MTLSSVDFFNNSMRITVRKIIEIEFLTWRLIKVRYYFDSEEIK